MSYGRATRCKDEWYEDGIAESESMDSESEVRRGFQSDMLELGSNQLSFRTKNKNDSTATQ